MSYIYSDMETGLPITKSGHVSVVFDEKCIRQSLMNIFSTVSLERVRNPIGSGLLRLLFQPFNDTTARQIKRELVTVIQRWEPRILVKKFDIVPEYDNHSYVVSVTYEISRLGKEYNLRTGLRSFA